MKGREECFGMGVSSRTEPRNYDACKVFKNLSSRRATCQSVQNDGEPYEHEAVPQPQLELIKINIWVIY